MCQYTPQPSLPVGFIGAIQVTPSSGLSLLLLPPVTLPSVTFS
jgi:hypothetical protein